MGGLRSDTMRDETSPVLESAQPDAVDVDSASAMSNGQEGVKKALALREARSKKWLAAAFSRFVFVAYLMRPYLQDQYIPSYPGYHAVRLLAATAGATCHERLPKPFGHLASKSKNTSEVAYIASKVLSVNGRACFQTAGQVSVQAAVSRYELASVTALFQAGNSVGGALGTR